MARFRAWLAFPSASTISEANDLGIAHVPWPIEVGDLVALEHAEYRVNDVVETGSAFPIAALVRVQQAHLRLAAPSCEPTIDELRAVNDPELASYLRIEERKAAAPHLH